MLERNNIYEWKMWFLKSTFQISTSSVFGESYSAYDCKVDIKTVRSEVLPENYQNRSKNLHQDFMNESDFPLRLDFLNEI